MQPSKTKNNMKDTSLTAFKNPNNKERRLSHKNQINAWLIATNPTGTRKTLYTKFSISSFNLSDMCFENFRKRIADLMHTGVLISIDTIQTGGQSYEVLKYVGVKAQCALKLMPKKTPRKKIKAQLEKVINSGCLTNDLREEILKLVI